MKSIAALILLLMTALKVSAAPNCLDKYEVLDNTTVQSIPGSKGCYITINPRYTQDMTYRSFLFDTEGLFMIFTSLGRGPESETTGAREFYFFPRRQGSLIYNYDPILKRLSLTTPNGKVFVFNTEKAILIGISDTTFTMDYEINGNNRGGVEITRNKGLYLDVGYQLGQSPSQNSKRKIHFRDSQNHTCTVLNADVFSYSPDRDVDFKFNDVQLSRFITRKCPNLKL